MKIGDKVYCIKSYKNNNGLCPHLKNNFYIIKDIDFDGALNKRIWIFSETSTTPNGYLGYLMSGELYSGFHYFNEHFVPEKELRKKKLEKIKSSWINITH